MQYAHITSQVQAYSKTELGHLILFLRCNTSQCHMFHLLHGFIRRIASFIPDFQWDRQKLSVPALHLGGGRVPSPRLIREVLRDLLDVQVVIDAPVAKKQHKQGVS